MAAFPAENDPRQSRRAIRTTVYEKILGGNINILRKRRASAPKPGAYTPTRTLQPGQRGGNRRRRTQRTIDLMSYQGADRGFVLRFLNAGTTDRKTRYGSRGAIAPRNWFGNASQTRLKDAAQQLDRIIDDVIKGVIY